MLYFDVVTMLTLKRSEAATPYHKKILKYFQWGSGHKIIIIVGGHKYLIAINICMCLSLNLIFIQLRSGFQLSHFLECDMSFS